MLAPGGFLCIYEFTSVLPAMVWGLSTQCWGFDDERDYSLWITIKRWDKLLDAAGFVKVRCPISLQCFQVKMCTRMINKFVTQRAALQKSN